MKLSYEQLKETIASFVDEDKIAVTTFSVTKDNAVGLLDKVGKIFTLDSSFIDKLSIFDGEELQFGKTIEEWQEDLILPEEYDPTGAGALKYHKPTYRPVSYSYSLGRKKFPISIKNDDLERAVNNVEQFNELMTLKSKRLFDSVAAYKYQCKREIIATLINRCEMVMGGTGYTGEEFDVTESYDVGELVKNASTATAWGVVVKPYTASTTGITDWDDAVAAGYIVVYDLIKTIAIPSDTSTGEAFVKQIKKDVELANDMGEGNSLNGNFLGATNSLVLLVKQGIIPEVEVDVMAGAFQAQNVAIPATTIVVKDFGSANSDVYAVLLDSRAIRLHNTYNATREGLNEDGDFLNMVHHREETAFFSLNTFVKVYKSN